MPSLEVEISSKAKEYEKLLGFSWIPSQKNPLSPLLYLRSCEQDYELKPFEKKAFSTGIYISLSSQEFLAEVTTYSDIAYNKGIIILDSPCIFNYYYNNQIYVMLYNTTNIPQEVKNAELIASLSLRKKEIITIDVVNQITIKDKNLGKHTWITKEKNKENTLNKYKKNSNYSKQDVEEYIKR